MDGAGALYVNSLLVGLAEANVMGTLEYALVSEEYTSSYLFVGRRKRGTSNFLFLTNKIIISAARPFMRLIDSTAMVLRIRKVITGMADPIADSAAATVNTDKANN